MSKQTPWYDKSNELIAGMPLSRCPYIGDDIDPALPWQQLLREVLEAYDALKEENARLKECQPSYKRHERA